MRPLLRALDGGAPPPEAKPKRSMIQKESGEPGEQRQ